LALPGAAGAASVAVLYGAHEPETLRAIGPDALLGSVGELADWLAAACGVARSLLGPVSVRR
jgi:hypothetical protein